MKYLILALVLILAGCAYSSRAKERVRETNTVTGTVAAMPVELRHDRVVEREESEEGTRDLGIEPVVGAVAQATVGGGNMLTGGASGLALGLVGMGLAWWQKRKAEAALTQTVTGLEAAKSAMPAESVEVLHSNLSRVMDASTKARVKRAKVSIS